MSEVEPALTESEWGALQAGRLDIYDDCVRWDGREHRLAAVALHGQPYGFTWEDVAALRDAADHEQFVYTVTGPDTATRMLVHEVLADLADRIAALLPPRHGG